MHLLETRKLLLTHGSLKVGIKTCLKEMEQNLSPGECMIFMDWKENIKSSLGPVQRGRNWYTAPQRTVLFLELVSLPKMQLGLSTTKNTLSFRKCRTKNQNREPRVQILPFRPVLGRSRPALPNGFAVKSFWFFKKVGDQVVRKLRVGVPETEMKQFRTIYSKPLRKWGSLGYKKSRQSRLKMRNTII